MSEHRGRGWVAALAAMALVTAAAVVGYVAAPFDPAPNVEADTGAPDVVDAEHRIVAVDDDGALVILDDRDGTLSEIVRPGVEGELAGLDVTAGHEAAYVEREDGTIDLVRLKTGEAERHSSGHALALGPIAFPQLPRTVERPKVEQMATVQTSTGDETIVVENLTTGARQHIEGDGDGPIERIDHVSLSPFQNRLFGVANDGTALFRIDVDRAESLSQATVVEAPDDVARYGHITPFGDTIAAIVERDGGATELVEIDRRTLEPSDVLLTSDDDGALRSVDADAEATSLLVTTEDGTLLEWTPALGGEPRQLASGIALAVW